MINKFTMNGQIEYVGTRCMKDVDGAIVVDDHKIDGRGTLLMNEEFDWDKENLEDVKPDCSPCDFIPTSKVGAAIAQSKSGKAVGQSGVAVEMFKQSEKVDTAVKLKNGVSKEFELRV